MSATVIGSVAVMAAALMAAAFVSRRRSLSQLAVRWLYRWARFWWCLACATDNAVVRFRMEHLTSPIEPACECELGVPNA